MKAGRFFAGKPRDPLTASEKDFNDMLKKYEKTQTQINRNIVKADAASRKAQDQTRTKGERQAYAQQIQFLNQETAAIER